MIENNKGEIFAQVDAFLEMIDETDRNKVPKKLRDLYKENKKPGYNPVYSKKIPLENQDIKREAIAMIALLHLNYWCKTEEEKQELRNIFHENEIKYQQELKEKYNTENIFNNPKKEEIKDIEEETPITEEKYMVEYKESFYVKIINFIKGLFKKKN